jgi:hypothetical protein
MGATHHNGIAVFGSGFCVGSKGNISGLFGAGGDRSGCVDSFVGPSGVDGLIRFDTGKVAFSGYTTVSTRLSSIASVVANVYGTVKCSGVNSVMVNWSGHQLDLTTKDDLAGAAASGYITWLAVGK